MQEAITLIKEIGNVGIPTLIIGLAGYWLIRIFPIWQREMSAGKKERAEIYASALKELSKQVNILATKIDSITYLVEKFGEYINEQEQTTERFLLMLDKHEASIRQVGKQCEKILERLVRK